MKNTVLIGISVLLIFFVIAVRYIFNKRFEAFKLEIESYETDLLNGLRTEKETRIAHLLDRDQMVHDLFINQFDEAESIIQKDTIYSFLYLRREHRYNAATLHYIDCLNNKCVSDINNEITQSFIENKEISYESRFGPSFTFWYAELKDEFLINRTNIDNYCVYFFPDQYIISYNNKAWKDFENLLIKHNKDINDAIIYSKQSEDQLSLQIRLTKRRLRSSATDYFDNQLSENRSKIIASETESKTFNSSIFGIINYDITKTIFNKEDFNAIADDAFEAQWRSNSLHTGATPYSRCFGSNNTCNHGGCSQIKVTAGSRDVLVTVKNFNGVVVRHAYIRGGGTFTFNVLNGLYNVFFYSGTGWNPYKNMQSLSCNSLMGGFVLNESITKDDVISLKNHVLTYQLTRQQSGNFNPKQSTVSEAF